MNNLNLRAWLSLVVLAVIMALLLFVPAGTTDDWQAWMFLLVFFCASVLHTAYLMKHDPALLQRRMRGGPLAEKETAQKAIMFAASSGFIALLVVSGLDRRYGWSMVPIEVVIVGDILIVVGYLIIFFVFRENTFTAATIEVMNDQRVISTGPYALVRHPMYAGGLLYLLGMPLALGSYVALIPFAASVPFLFWRLFDEERLLTKDLPGYAAYCEKVRWRLIPGVF